MPRTGATVMSVVGCVLLFVGCSGGQGGGSAANLEVRDGVAVYSFPASGREQKLGNVENDQVKLFNTYGGGTMPLEHLRQLLAGIPAEDEPGQIRDYQQERQAIVNAVLADWLPGIWQVESASVDGAPEPVREDDPSYLVLRADKTFRIIKKGKKPAGTWRLNPKGRLVLDAANDQAHTMKLTRRDVNKFELIADEGGKTLTAIYVRTDLTADPKAADEV